jgi:hypothetical protein
MYKTLLQIDLSDTPRGFVEASISWLTKSNVVKCVNDYIKGKKLKEIIKEGDAYLISWSSKESYKEFLSEDVYLSVVSRLKELGVSISWKE